MRRVSPWTGRTWFLPTVTIASSVGILAVIWLISATSADPYFPPLATSLARSRELWLSDAFVVHIVPSLRNLAVGYTVAVTFGITLGLAMGMRRRLRWALYPVVNFVRAVPPVALVPVLLTVMGLGEPMRVVSIGLAALFPTLIATVDGVRSADEVKLATARVYRLSSAQRVYRVLLPEAAPRIASGMQVSLQTAFVVMIASEMLGSAVGIGAMTILAQQTFAIPDMWSGIILLGVIGFLANVLFETIRRRVLHWYFGQREAQT